MTKLETMKCEKLLDEAIRNAETANEEFYKAGIVMIQQKGIFWKLRHGIIEDMQKELIKLLQL